MLYWKFKALFIPAKYGNFLIDYLGLGLTIVSEYLIDLSYLTQTKMSCPQTNSERYGHKLELKTTSKKIQSHLFVDGYFN